MAATTSAPTLGNLLERRDLGLRAVTRIPRARRDVELRWVHSSDLPDPAPFLDDGVALLTTGAQLADTDADEYVARLVARGVAALGFGSGVVRAAIPDDLAQACERTGLPLFEVPYRTPFLAVVRAAADAIAAHGFARRAWALAAQRAVSLAALRADPLPAAIAELARQLGAWVGLFDPAGALSIARPAPLAESSGEELSAVARRMLDAGVRAADTVTVGERTFTVQTLGRGGHLRGALAIEGADIDQEARGVVTTVVAMAGFALERAAELTRERGALRAGVLRALLHGDEPLAREIARAAWGRLPREPVRAWSVLGSDDDVLGYLEARAEHAPGAIFFAPADDEIIALTSEGAEPLDPVWERFGAPIGSSRPTGYARLAAAIDEARTARPREGMAEFAPGSADLFRAPGDEQIAAARALLDPLRRHDARGGTSLERNLRVWLDCDAAHDRAATALGIHRHTMRARVTQAAALLDRDLTTFEGRATVWAALRATDA
ncbi:PucR family transcriptional regulator [Microbacterium karelineae]|uniref:PucR family transcriptional regulator n=1 Tax=Microbacterium karelineae TaxID=2654283 RepID=UPI0012E9DBAA|nr:PucR family transcriptional regulator [Microbacterium karelineae]